MKYEASSLQRMGNPEMECFAGINDGRVGYVLGKDFDILNPPNVDLIYTIEDVKDNLQLYEEVRLSHVLTIFCRDLLIRHFNSLASSRLP